MCNNLFCCSCVIKVCMTNKNLAFAQITYCSRLHGHMQMFDNCQSNNFYTSCIQYFIIVFIYLFWLFVCLLCSLTFPQATLYVFIFPKNKTIVHQNMQIVFSLKCTCFSLRTSTLCKICTGSASVICLCLRIIESLVIHRILSSVPQSH